MLKKYLSMIRDDLEHSMQYRCGQDELNNLFMLFGFIFVLCSLFTRKWGFTLVGSIFIGLSYYRVFSKNLDKRRYENSVYMKYMGDAVRFVEYLVLCVKMKCKSISDKEYVYFVCSQCKQVIRVPKRKNKVSIRCPKCDNTFIKTT